MKLSQEDKSLLLSWGHTEDDFWQIEEAFKKKYTKYELGDKAISRDEAIELLGREEFLSGVARSAFHCTAVRETFDGKTIYFDSHKLFEKSDKTVDELIAIATSDCEKVNKDVIGKNDVDYAKE